MSKQRQPQQPLSHLLDGISTQKLQNDAIITGLCIDSRQVKAGDCFFAYPGTVTDGRQFIQQALAAGAKTVLYEPHPDITPSEHCIPVLNIQRHIGTIASRFWANSLEKLTLVGITGTNGKSTCSYWLSHILSQAGCPSAMIGTIGIGPVGALTPATLTTPDPISLHQQLAQFAHEGIKTVVMEASSHSLSQHRVVGVPFHYAAFTNLSHEHLDYHGTMRDYAEAKSRLFDFATLKGAVINADDAVGNHWLKTWAKNYPLRAYSCQGEHALPASIPQLIAKGIRPSEQLTQQFTVVDKTGETLWEIPVIGRFNVSNALACASLLQFMGMSMDDILLAMRTLPAVPGRMQVLQHQQKPTCIVDYAHTPDALDNVLVSLRDHCRGQLWCVFGCGGDRDKAKRPAMGKVAAAKADQVILTNDNPRSESPAAIIQDITAGIPEHIVAPYVADRRLAIAQAIRLAKVEDVILVAGKGHESMQILGKEKHPFSDVQTIQELMQTELT